MSLVNFFFPYILFEETNFYLYVLTTVHWFKLSHFMEYQYLMLIPLHPMRVNLRLPVFTSWIFKHLFHVNAVHLVYTTSQLLFYWALYSISVYWSNLISCQLSSFSISVVCLMKVEYCCTDLWNPKRGRTYVEVLTLFRNVSADFWTKRSGSDTWQPLWTLQGLLILYSNT